MSTPTDDLTLSPSDPLFQDLLKSGEKLGDYLVGRCLSFNFLGGLYNAHLPTSGASNLVYVFSRNATWDRKFPARLLEVAEKVKKVQHPGALTLLAYQEINGRHCLIYEPFEGVILENVLTERERLLPAAPAGPVAPTPEPAPAATPTGSAAPADEVVLPPPEELAPPTRRTPGLSSTESLLVLTKLAAAIKSSHEGDARHFQIGPDSVLYRPGGEVKLWGIGLYEMLGQELLEKLVSAGIPPILSPDAPRFPNPVDHFSPEMRRGGPFDSRSDVFALGALAYRLLTGEKPTGQVPTPPSQLQPSLHVRWDFIIGRCLEFEAEARYPTVGALLSDLEEMPSRISGEYDRPKSQLAQQVEKIPVPEPIARRLTPLQLKIFRLISLGLFGMAVIGLGTLSVIVLFTDYGPTSGGGAVVETVSDPQEANLQLRVRPPGAKIKFGGRGQGEFQATLSPLALKLPPGRYEVRVEAPNHVASETTLEVLKAGQLQEISLKPNFGQLEVAAPAGAELWWTPAEGSAHFVGTVPAEGLLAVGDRLLAGTHNFEVRLAGYQSQAFAKVALGPTAVRLQAEPQARPGRLRVLTEPAGATVIFAERERGITPLEIADLPVLQPLTFTVTHPDYRSRATTVLLQAGQQGDLDFGPLEPKVGSIQITVDLAGQPPTPADLAALRLRLEKEEGAFQPLLANVPAGSRSLEIRHPNYETWTQSVSVTDETQSAVTASLRPRPAQVTVRLAGDFPYEFFANGQAVRGRDHTYPVPPLRPLNLEIRVRDHFPTTQTATFRANQKEVWSVTPVRIPPPQTGQPAVVPYLEISLPWLEPGEVRLGSPIKEQGRRTNEGDGGGRQPRAVLTRGFWMGRLEITQAQYSALMGANPSQYVNPRNPVEQVTWFDAHAFAAKLTEVEKAAGRLPEGYVYRLPTQAEWEYAARAGTTTPFHFGESADPSKGNFQGIYPRLTTGGTISGTSQTTPVPGGQYPANAWGLHDFHGNVAEWCADPYNDRYPSGQLVDWAGSPESNGRPVRGGSFETPAADCRVAARIRASPGTASDTIGFRVVLAPDLPIAPPPEP